MLLNRIYLPVKVLDKQSADKLVNGSVHMEIRGDDPALYADIPADLPDDFDAMIERGYYVDRTEAYTRYFSMMCLEYDKESDKYKPLDTAASQLGDTAVILCNPPAFFKRLAGVYQSTYPDRYVMGVYEEQREVRIGARVKDNIRVVSAGENAAPAHLELGELKDIVLEIPVNDLIQGKIPMELYGEEIRRNILDCELFPIGITANTKIVAGEFASIEPKREWITLLQKLLDEKDWTPVTRMERLVPEGAEIPRLAFYHKTKADKVFFMRDRIELYRELPDVHSLIMFEKILSLLELRISSRYCHMTDLYHVNLGKISEKHRDKTFIQERYDEYKQPYFCVHNLMYGSPKQQNIFGLNVFEQQWRYELQISTHPEENICWYDKDTVIEFLRRTEKVAEEKISRLKGGEVYERFHNLNL